MLQKSKVVRNTFSLRGKPGMIAAPIANMESQRKVKTYSLCVKNDDAASPCNLGFAFLNNINKFSSRNNNLGADIILYTNW